jgi:hypothetical protein
VCERGLVFARFFLLNLGKPASDGDFFASFFLKKRREGNGCPQDFFRRIGKFFLKEISRTTVDYQLPINYPVNFCLGKAAGKKRQRQSIDYN